MMDATANDAEEKEEKVEYLSCAETAKIIRKVLQAAFPAQKFSVRSDTYSGGASIRVSWVDGPRQSRVETVTRQFEGATFDGMIDLKSYHSTVLVGPNGPREVHFGADFIFCSRRESKYDELHAEALEWIRSHCRLDETGQMFGNEWITNLASGMVRALDFEKGTTLQDTFNEVVLRQ